MKGNKDKCDQMTEDKSSEIHIGESILKSSGCEKKLGIKIDSKINYC